MRHLRTIGVALVPTAALALLTLIIGPAGPIFWLGYSVALVATLLSLRVLLSSSVGLSLALVTLFSSERFLIAVAAPQLATERVTALLVYDEFVFPALVVVGLPYYLGRWRQQPRPFQFVDLVVVAFALVVAVGFVFSDAPLQERLIYARRFLVLPMTYLAARTVRVQQGNARLAIAIVVAGGIAVAGFGLLERFSPPGMIWGGLADPNAYYATAPYSGSATSGAPDAQATIAGLPHAFWSFEGGVPSRRLVSTFLEAPTLSLFLSLVLLLGIALTLDLDTRQRLGMLPGLAAVVMALGLTLGKGGWALALAGSTYLFAARLRPRLASRAVMVLLAVAMCLGLVGIAVVAELFGVNSGLRMHLAGLTSGLDTALSNPLGLGLGSSGVFSSRPMAAAGESMLGVLLAQLGWPGAAAWTFWLVSAGLAVAISTRSQPDLRGVGLAAGTAMVLLPAAGALTESVGGLVGMWAFGVVTGLLSSDVEARRLDRFEDHVRSVSLRPLSHERSRPTPRRA
ncbi:MAG: hypothetical protein KatS3mg065_0263 [Chloroflexota bacterium]|nr:MAG: hypothetical protein KatS3mg065_0263 [Chloroflexota bacterium]